MSQTFTLPVTAADQFNHGHERRNSRPHRRQSRLAPAFSLPRIPSGAPLPAEQVLHQQNDVVNQPVLHQNHTKEGNRTSRTPSLDSNAPLKINKRLFEAKNTPATTMPHQHRHVSKPTDVLLHATENYSLLHGILADRESRRIFYFMLLNLAFMGVQSTYGFLTGSLGLISDSIHMFFDCVALLVGVCAAVMSKWPPSTKFPYGYGKIDTLAGLGNGIFLMLISVEIVYEATERLFSGSEVQRTTELLLVSLAGLAVNLVGIFAFHGHHGHHHGHDHSHSHPHDSHDGTAAKPTSGAHGHHHHGGENMQGIYLHIMADALGSVAVVASTLLVQATGWSGWDPLASCIIAILIFASTVPLVSSTIKILLLSLNSDVEYNLRDVLGGISSIRGVTGYTVPKFWIEDIKKDPHDHDHHHAHDHDHDHSHNHTHSHPQPSAYDDHHQHQQHSSHAHACSHSHSDSNSYSHTNLSPSTDSPRILGTIHIQIHPTASLADVQSRISQYFHARNMDIIVQYEREGENKCWCSAVSPMSKTPSIGGIKTPLTGSRGSFSFGLSNGFPGSGSGGGVQGKGVNGVGSPLGKML